MPKFDDSMTSQEAWFSALDRSMEEAAVSCWRRVSCVGGGIGCPLEKAVASCWRRVSCVGGGTSFRPLEEAAALCWRRVPAVGGDIGKRSGGGTGCLSETYKNRVSLEEASTQLSSTSLSYAHAQS